MTSPTARTRVHRIPERGVYDRAVIDAILDEGLVCHIGFVDGGLPVVIPTLYARVDDGVYVHGSAASRMLRQVAAGADMCLTVTLVDGLVLARSAFHHSINYRSVVVFGRARMVEDSAEKLVALEAFAEHIMPGRWRDARPPNAQELKATKILALPLTEASAKVRSGPPKDDEADYSLATWAGVIPASVTYGSPVSDPRLATEVAAPDYVRNYRRPTQTQVVDEGAPMANPSHTAQQRLAALLGRWRTVGATRATKESPAQAIEAWDTYEWLPGRCALLHRVDARVGDEQVEGAEIIGWDPTRDCYVTQYFGTDGPNAYEATLTEENGKLVWRMRSESDRFMGTFTEDGNTIHGYWEQRRDADTWEPWMQITLTRQ
jgi:nitroimidazol reductase NimA-like FMN-containing flavoprotein (pyridoxamine 5'-phosphate oxidase superfamily)